jgi:N-methylhydantoinase A
MGGTTAKMSLIDRRWPERVHEFEAGRVRRFRKGSGLPVKVPVVDMIEIGAGGGSLAWVDPMELLKVGPQSAGADPGPACYGQGGVLPTVTDADLLLGYVSPDYFLGGEMRLDRGAAERAIDAHVARPLDLSTEEAAVGIHAVVNENMAAATRMHIAEKGRDPRRYTLVAFGGAGPVHAYGLARLLKLPRILCPFGAGVTSALGFLVAAPAIDYVPSYVARLESIDWQHVTHLFAEMERDASALLVETGARTDEIAVRRAADMRYVGQGFEVTVPLPGGPLDGGGLPRLRERFFEMYQRLFARATSGTCRSRRSAGGWVPRGRCRTCSSASAGSRWPPATRARDPARSTSPASASSRATCTTAMPSSPGQCSMAQRSSRSASRPSSSARTPARRSTQTST